MTDQMSNREELLVDLVDDSGASIGVCTVAEAHSDTGRPHRAFSVVLHDQSGRVLLQQRASTKTRFALLWSNTCCGHPAPGEDIFIAASTRLSAELGLTPGQVPELAEAGVLKYRALDLTNGALPNLECKVAAVE